MLSFQPNSQQKESAVATRRAASLKVCYRSKSGLRPIEQRRTSVKQLNLELQEITDENAPNEP